MDKQMDGHKDKQCETIIPCHYCVGVKKNEKMHMCIYPPILSLTSRHQRQKTCIIIATDKALFFIRKMLISFLFVNKNICCGYSLEAPRRGASNVYPQHMFSWRNKKNIMQIPHLICSYVLCRIMTYFLQEHICLSLYSWTAKIFPHILQIWGMQ